MMMGGRLQDFAIHQKVSPTMSLFSAVWPLKDLGDLTRSVRLALTSRYTRKIIPGEGLCIRIQNESIIIKEKVVILGSGAVQTVCTFECVVFRPVVGELLTATVTS